MTESCVYLDTYVLQQDMRIRLPKAIISNLGAEKGKTMFDIFFNAEDNTLILRKHTEEEKNNG